MEQVILFLQDLYVIVWRSLANAWSVPAAIWLPIALSILFCFLFLRALFELVPLFLRRHSGLKELKIKINNLPEDDTVYMTSEHMDGRFGKGKRPEVLHLRSKKRSVYAHLAKRKNTTLGSETIEMSLGMVRRLFPSVEIPEGDGQIISQDLEIHEHASNGWLGYWHTPNERTRFQNRFAVYLGVGLVALQVLLEFGLRV